MFFQTKVQKRKKRTKVADCVTFEALLSKNNIFLIKIMWLGNVLIVCLLACLLACNRRLGFPFAYSSFNKGDPQNAHVLTVDGV